MFNNKKIFVVAEIGNNHEGSFDLAKKLIRLAAKAGADAVKFQTFIPENYVSSNDKKRIKQLKKFQLNIEQFKSLSIYAKKLKLIFFSTPFDIESAKKLNEFQSIFKISSGDNNFFKLIETVASFNKPLIISTGFADLNLVRNIHSRVLSIWKKKKANNQLAFLHCVSNYPVELKESNIGAILTLKKKFDDCIIGYSDHTIGNKAATYAAILGAKIIEKHFTIDKNYSKFRDHKISANPKEFSKLVETLKELPEILGNGLIKLEKSEKRNIKLVRRSIITNKVIQKNHIIFEKDINWVRPGNGIAPGNEKKIIGKKVKQKLDRNGLIRFKNLI